MKARYDGECIVCDGAIWADEHEIVRKGRGWAHDGCVTPTEGDLLGSSQVCEVCNLAMPCWCDDNVVEDAHLVDPGSRAAIEALARYRAAAARDPFEGFL